MNLTYSKLDCAVDLSQFTCGDSQDHIKLDNFLKERAHKHQKDLIGTTLLAWLEKNKQKELVGFMTLRTCHIQIEEENKTNFFKKVLIKNKYDTYPAIMIGRLGVQKEYGHKGKKSVSKNYTVTYIQAAIIDGR